MWKEKPPGLKILWVWTFGTAAVLVANVVRTRVKDMDNFINNTTTEQQEQQQEQHSTATETDGETVLVNTTQSDQIIREEKS